MNSIAKVMKYELSDVLRSRWLLVYTLFFLVITDGLLRFSGGGANAELGLLNVVLVIVPLVSIVLGTMHVYNSREFTELLLAQPIGRRQLFGGLYLGLSVPLSLGCIVGLAVPAAFHAFDAAERVSLFMLLGVSIALTFCFTGLAFAVALRIDDKAKGLAAAIAIWLTTTVLYDGLVLLIGVMFADYSPERSLIALMLLNPVDLGRVLMLLQLDVSAVMGYTGASLKAFFGTNAGIALAVGTLLLWAMLPPIAALYRFRRKDF